MSRLEFFIRKLATASGINLLSAAYRGIGISPEFEALTEEFFKNILVRYLGRHDAITCFDVGANLGEVTKALVDHFDHATIHAFEPNPHTFRELALSVQNDRVVANNFGLGEKVGEGSLYFYGDDKTTGHASMYREVFELHKNSDVEEHKITLSTVDEYCRAHDIRQIDFLKIDTEGNEFFVLKGASRMLSGGSISVIQFEFNEMNIVSRVFLRDFYELLPGYTFFRIKGDELFPLGQYSSSNEIFRIQNILAVHNKFRS